MAARVRQPVGDGTEDWHGTPRGYTGHRCACERCLAVHAAINVKWLHDNPEKAAELKRRERVAYAEGRRPSKHKHRSRQPVGDGTEDWHGTPGGYTNHKCGCQRCRQAWADDYRDYRKGRGLPGLPEQPAKPRMRTGERERLRQAKAARQQTEQLLLASADGESRKLQAADLAKLRGATPEPAEKAEPVTGKVIHLLKLYSTYTVCGQPREQGRRVTEVITEANCKVCRSVPHRRHLCLHCGGTIAALEPEMVIVGARGPYRGQRRYFHALQSDCMAAARKAAAYQGPVVVSGGLVRGKR